MNREIIFRGKDKDGEWIEGSLLIDNIGSPCAEETYAIVSYVNLSGDVRDLSEINIFAVNPETVGQFTGLTDKNGKRIFEGDIVKGTAYSTEWVGVVIWIDTIASFGLRYQTGKGKLREEPTTFENSSIIKALMRWKIPNEFQAEVIDNIHDNPEIFDNKGGAGDGKCNN